MMGMPQSLRAQYHAEKMLRSLEAAERQLNMEDRNFVTIERVLKNLCREAESLREGVAPQEALDQIITSMRSEALSFTLFRTERIKLAAEPTQAEPQPADACEAACGMEMSMG